MLTLLTVSRQFRYFIIGRVCILPLNCLLIKILFCIYYLSTANFLQTYFRDITIGSEFRGIYFRRSIVVVFCAKLAEFNFAI